MTPKKEHDPWAGYDPNAPPKEKPNPEELVKLFEERIDQMQQAQKAMPRALILKQFVALVYMVVNIVFMYVSMGSRSVGYIAVYMVPLIIVLIDYFMVVQQLKQIATGEKK